MSIFAVALRTPNQQVFDRLKEQYSSHSYVISNTLALVASDGLAENVAMNVGIKGEDQVEDVSGIVFKLSGAYAGFTTRTIWEWLEENEARE